MKTGCARWKNRPLFQSPFYNLTAQLRSDSSAVGQHICLFTSLSHGLWRNGNIQYQRALRFQFVSQIILPMVTYNISDQSWPDSFTRRHSMRIKSTEPKYPMPIHEQHDPLLWLVVCHKLNIVLGNAWISICESY